MNSELNISIATELNTGAGTWSFAKTVQKVNQVLQSVLFMKNAPFLLPVQCFFSPDIRNKFHWQIPRILNECKTFVNSTDCIYHLLIYVPTAIKIAHILHATIMKTFHIFIMLISISMKTEINNIIIMLPYSKY